MEYLPTSADARIPRESIFLSVCSKCYGYKYFHEGQCVDGWGRMSPMIREDTRNAILQHSKREKQKENDKIFHFFKPNDWLIYNRCVVFYHHLYAPGVLRSYSIIPDIGAFNVYIMVGRIEDDFHLCKEMIEESVKYIKKRNPNVTVIILERETKYVDFSRLVFAPNVLVSGMGSSWALWSAIMANNNTVVSVLPHKNIDMTSLPSSVQILTDVPIMLDPKVSKEAAKDYGIPFGRFSNSKEHRKSVMEYFRNA